MTIGAATIATTKRPNHDRLAISSRDWLRRVIQEAAKAAGVELKLTETEVLIAA